ncbi:hypothetical protein RF638_15455 [Kocuria sp. CPCC 205235]
MEGIPHNPSGKGPVTTGEMRNGLLDRPVENGRFGPISFSVFELHRRIQKPNGLPLTGP